MAKRPRVKGKGVAIFLGEDKPSSQQTNKPVKQYTGKTVNTSKATFYLPTNLIDDLENTWLSLRGKYKDKRVTKSEIARIALKTIINDWKEKHNKSTLVKRLTGK
ncbi:MAG: hypothetical protein KKC53_05505 [Actinobacteria bacterium]|nr:hypothetical protein [Actinomycetota bacterium]